MPVVLLNAVIGYIQEFKAEESVRALKKMIVSHARVLREGKEKEINSVDLVPGDIVLLSSGSRVPADLRLFKTIELKVEEAMLTGESIPAEKNISTIIVLVTVTIIIAVEMDKWIRRRKLSVSSY